MPTSCVSQAIHLDEGICENAAESADEDGAQVEPRQSLLDFISHIPHADQIETATHD